MAVGLFDIALWTVLAIPPAIGAYSIRNLHRFRRGAFGLFAGGATSLIIAIAAGLLYYVFVMLLLWREGTFDAARLNPLGSTSLLILVQSLAAALTLAALVTAGRKFLSIVEP